MNGNSIYLRQTRVFPFFSHIRPNKSDLSWLHDYQIEHPTNGVYHSCKIIKNTELSEQEINFANEAHNRFVPPPGESYQETFPAEELYQHVPPKRVNREPWDGGDCFLVVPGPLDESTHGSLRLRLCDRFDVTELRGSFNSNPDPLGTLYFVKALYGSRPSPHDLPGLPEVLISYNSDYSVFLPFGTELPKEYGDFIPSGNTLHLWSERSSVRPQYDAFTPRADKRRLLPSVELLPDILPRAPRATPATCPDIPLELRRTTTPHDPGRIHEVLYKYRSAPDAFSTPMLAMLDYNEAGLAKMEYFGLAVQDENKPKVEFNHFFVSNYAIESEAAWPELRRYNRLAGFDALNLRLFIPADFQFVPRIDLLLSASDSGELALRLRRSLLTAMKLDEDYGKDGIIVLDKDGGGWKYTLLSRGRPIHEVVGDLLPSMYPRPQSELLFELPDQQKSIEADWLKGGEKLTAELQGITENYIRELKAQIDAIESSMAEAEKRVLEGKKVIKDGNAVASNARVAFLEFVEQCGALIEKTSKIRLDWLKKNEEWRTAIHDQIQQSDVFTTDALREIEGIETQTDTALQKFKSMRQAMSGRVDELKRREKEYLDTLSKGAKKDLKKAAKALEGAMEKVGDMDTKIAKLESDTERLEERVKRRVDQARLRNRKAKIREASAQREKTYLLSLEKETDNVLIATRKIENYLKICGSGVSSERSKALRELQFAVKNSKKHLRSRGGWLSWLPRMRKR